MEKPTRVGFFVAKNNFCRCYGLQEYDWCPDFVDGSDRMEKEKACIAAGLCFSGSPTWTRTRDLRINSPSLYRLSYQGMKRCA